ncbi:MAG TPA: allantoate amidohydrolase [Opitutaceae bacterium]|nr:allantoate amidohydrolase [Opitutaceae bacterium]
MAAAKKLAGMLAELGRISDEPGRLTRTFLSPAMRRANRQVGKWMREAGLAVRVDGVGNLIGRLASRNPKAKTLLIGSHLDTVRNAGKFDGALGVLLPIVALAELRQRKVKLPFHVEVLGFSEEEGVRFASAYLGSKGYAGQLSASELKHRDARGISIAQALAQFNGGSFSPPRAARKQSNLLGYFEVHIEQGPVLEKEKLAVGVVSAIAGQTRGKVRFRGKAGHAGTTPMTLRRDALAGSAEFVLAVETLAQSSPGLVATVGVLEVPGAAPNVVPGETTLTLDVRHARDGAREAAVESCLLAAQEIARRRKLRFDWQRTQQNGAVACAPVLAALLAQSVRAVQGRSLSLVSGAGHDAVVMSALTPVAMLFVRCREGLSHHPDEHASPADVAVALRVAENFIERLARNASAKTII